MTGLSHPTDLAAWQRWQDRQHPLRALRGRLRTSSPGGVLTLGSPDADVLVVLESGSASNRAALLAPALSLPPERVALLTPTGLTGLPSGGAWSSRPWSGGSLPPVRAVLSAGHYLGLGAAADAHAVATGVPSAVVQHGLLTPSNPPLPAGAVALVWSDADADFWRSGRTDVETRVVGSQLLWEAGAVTDPVVTPGPPTYLGQLHGAELPRRDLVAAAEAFCRATGAAYRPHPSERDRRSLAQHARWEAAGIRIDRGGVPLAEIGTGVVSVFSTGVLEAAARGLPAWVDHPRPPAWLREFWERYAMAPWGGPPTAAPPRPAAPPAATIADLVGSW